MDTLQLLVVALAGLFSGGCALRIIILCFQMGFEPNDKSGYKQQIKHTLTCLVISLVVTGTGALPALVLKYFK